MGERPSHKCIFSFLSTNTDSIPTSCLFCKLILSLPFLFMSISRFGIKCALHDGLVSHAKLFFGHALQYHTVVQMLKSRVP